MAGRVVYADPLGSFVDGYEEARARVEREQRTMFDTLINPVIQMRENELDRQFKRELAGLSGSGGGRRSSGSSSSGSDSGYTLGGAARGTAPAATAAPKTAAQPKSGFEGLIGGVGGDANLSFGLPSAVSADPRMAAFDMSAPAQRAAATSAPQAAAAPGGQTAAQPVPQTAPALSFSDSGAIERPARSDVAPYAGNAYQNSVDVAEARTMARDLAYERDSLVNYVESLRPPSIAKPDSPAMDQFQVMTSDAMENISNIDAAQAQLEPTLTYGRVSDQLAAAPSASPTVEFGGRTARAAPAFAPDVVRYGVESGRLPPALAARWTDAVDRNDAYLLKRIEREISDSLGYQ